MRQVVDLILGVNAAFPPRQLLCEKRMAVCEQRHQIRGGATEQQWQKPDWLARGFKGEDDRRKERVRCADQRWYELRVSPYRTLDHSIKGAVILLVNSEDKALLAAGGAQDDAPDQRPRPRAKAKPKAKGRN